MPHRPLELVRGGDPAALVAPGDGAGLYLKRAREAKGVTLEDVALRTKVKIEFLRLLEQGRLGELPAPVFVRGFARAYAQVVGADPDEATRRLRAQYGGSEPAAPAAPEIPVESAGPEPFDRRRFGMVLVVLVLLLAATLTLSLLLRRQSPTAGGLSAVDAEQTTLAPRG